MKHWACARPSFSSGCRMRFCSPRALWPSALVLLAACGVMVNADAKSAALQNLPSPAKAQIEAQTQTQSGSATPAVQRPLQWLDHLNRCLGSAATASPNSSVATVLACATPGVVPLATSALGEIRREGRCLGIAGASLETGYGLGGGLVWSACVGTVNQFWQLRAGQTVSVMHGLCLTAPLHPKSRSLSMQVCGPDVRQQWRVSRQKPTPAASGPTAR